MNETLEGAELDEAVAVNVMEWHKSPVPQAPHLFPSRWLWAAESGKIESTYLFRPSDNIEGRLDTLLVLKKALADGMVIELSAAQDTGEARAEVWLLHDLHYRAIATGPTLAVAICRALVKAYPKETP